MKVHLADVGGIPDPFNSRVSPLARSWRNTGTGTGGGGGTGGEGGEEKETEEETSEDDEDDETEEQEQETPESLKERAEKAEKTAKRRDSALRKAQAELAKLREEKEKPGDEDPVAKANARLLNASARTVLTAAGIADKEDQKLILSMIDLSDVDVDDEDGPDEDAIEEKISDLRRIFGGTSKPERPGSRTPRGVKAPDRGKGETTDPDASRYRRFMRG